jgi:hypothetical protein
MLILFGHKQVALENAALRHQLAMGKTSAEAPLSRSSVLDIAHEDLGKMENGARDRTTCYCRELASASIQAVLVEALPEQW